MKERQKLTNILIIEDDEDIREGVRILLEGEQYQKTGERVCSCLQKIQIL